MISEQSQSHIFPKYVKNLSFTVSTGDDHHQDQGGTTWAAKLPLSVASRVNCLLLLMHTRHWCTLLDTGAHYFTLLHAALNVLQCTNLSLCNEHWRCHRTTISISLQQFSKHCFLTKKCFTSEKLFGRMVEEEREDSQSQSWRPTLLYCILWKQTTISAVIETKDVIHWLMLGQTSTAVGFLNLWALSRLHWLVGWEPAVSSLGDKKQCNNNRLKWPPMIKIETTVIILEYIEVEVPKQLDNMLRLQRALRKC